MTRGTTICCSAIALTLTAALAKTPAPAVSLLPLRPVWTLPLNNRITVPPAFDQTRAYLAIEHDRLVAYDLLPGTQLWLVEARPLFQPILSGDLVVLAETDALVALHAADGSAAWRAAIDEPFGRRPSAAHGHIVGVTKSGAALALRASDGSVVWRRDLGSEAHGSPFVADEVVYIPAADGRIVALRVVDGEPLWERRVGGSPNDITVDGDRLYVGSTDNFFYCLMTRDGGIDWRWRTGADVTGQAAVDAKRVYFVSLDNVLRALSRVSGGQQWMRALPLRPTSGPLLVRETILVSGQSPTIRTFAAKDGAPSPDIAAGDEVVAPPWAFTQATTGMPMLALVTRHIVRGDTVTLSARTLEPTPSPLAPLPNAVMPLPTPPTRP